MHCSQKGFRHLVQKGFRGLEFHSPDEKKGFRAFAAGIRESPVVEKGVVTRRMSTTGFRKGLGVVVVVMIVVMITMMSIGMVVVDVRVHIIVYLVPIPLTVAHHCFFFLCLSLGLLSYA